MSTAAPPLLAVRDLSKHFEVGRTGGLFNSRPRILRAAEGISFDLQRGQSLGLVPAEATSLVVAGAIVSIALNPLLFSGVEPLRRWVLARRSLLFELQDPEREHTELLA